MGHVTFTAPTLDEALANQTRAREILGIPELKQARPVGPA
jgi:hypothetical protein